MHRRWLQIETETRPVPSVERKLAGVIAFTAARLHPTDLLKGGRTKLSTMAVA
jgi:hypothetical protein